MTGTDTEAVWIGIALLALTLFALVGTALIVSDLNLGDAHDEIAGLKRERHQLIADLGRAHNEARKARLELELAQAPRIGQLRTGPLPMPADLDQVEDAAWADIVARFERSDGC